jgi:phenylacetate-coenzyme A ligase PaaK-like adenylate-forming protein
LEEKIGLPAENVRDTYGMAEHGIPYAACKKGFHHMPIYGRLLVRDPLSMKVLAPGQEGLLQLITPFNTAQSNLSVLSTDLCILKEDCPCGMPGLYISSIRRGGIRKHKGCAIAAQEILNRSQTS